MSRPAFDLVVWDFDGVLNRNLTDGRFRWSQAIAADLGLGPAAFEAFVFRGPEVRRAVRGEGDLLEAAADWLARQGSRVTPEALLDYWFAKDALPDAEAGQWLDALTVRKVIGTNNEARRAAYIADVMGFGARVERIFASGPMGVAKPDAGFFAAIEAWAGAAAGAAAGVPARVSAGRILLIDDRAVNVAAAHRRGWGAFHFTGRTRARLPGILGIG